MTESEIEAANSAPLFNIPPASWREHWRAIHRGETYSMGFWVGVYLCASPYDDDFEDRELLAKVAALIRFDL